MPNGSAVLIPRKVQVGVLAASLKQVSFSVEEFLELL
jgi:hypothetical protein